jgi:hypothetical protein
MQPMQSGCPTQHCLAGPSTLQVEKDYTAQWAISLQQMTSQGVALLQGPTWHALHCPAQLSEHSCHSEDLVFTMQHTNDLTRRTNNFRVAQMQRPCGAHAADE